MQSESNVWFYLLFVFYATSLSCSARPVSCLSSYWSPATAFMFDVTTQSLRMCEAVIENVLCELSWYPNSRRHSTEIIYRIHLQCDIFQWNFRSHRLCQQVLCSLFLIWSRLWASAASSLACITQFTAAHAERIWHSIDTNICWPGCSSNGNECHPGVRPAGCRSSCLLCKFALRHLQGNVGLNIWPITRPLVSCSGRCLWMQLN